MKIDSDSDRTAERLDQLDAYMATNVMTGENFVCTSERACKRSLKTPGLAFARGQLSHVGAHYDLAVNGVPVRILVIAMDTGRPDEFVTLDQRHQQVMDSAMQTFSARNPHMRGTTSALRVLLGDRPGEDDDGEWLALERGGQAHLFDAYAMANLRLCSAIKPPKSESKGTKAMSANCLRHLAATLEILQPTIVVLQSKQIRPAIRSHLTGSNRLTESLEQVNLCGVPVLLAELSHPSYPATKMHWGRVSNAPYLWDVVVPTLELARELAIPRVVEEDKRPDVLVEPVGRIDDAPPGSVGLSQDNGEAVRDQSASDNLGPVAGQEPLAGSNEQGETETHAGESESSDRKVPTAEMPASLNSRTRSLVSTGKDRVQRVIRSLGVARSSLRSRTKRSRPERKATPRKAPTKPLPPKSPSPILGLPDEEPRPTLPRKTGHSGPKIEICGACESPIHGGARCGCS